MATKTKVTKRTPFVGEYNNRSGDPLKDYRLVNAFPEFSKAAQDGAPNVYAQKRPGLVEFCDVAPDAEGRGLAWFNGHFYAVIGNTVWRITATGTTKTAIITLPSTTGNVAIMVCNSATIGDYLFLADGTVGWVVKLDNSATQITDIDFPTPHIPAVTFIDGYVLIAKESDVFNSNLDDPFTWANDHYITAEMFPDPIMTLARQSNQVVCLGTESIEFFYDNANPSGSPLSRNTAVAAQMGCAAPHAIYQNEQFCAFVGQSASGGRAVWKLEGYTPKKISTPYIDRIIDEETNMLGVTGFGFRTMGHLFFLINFPTIKRTLVYDIDTQLWHEWSSFIGAPPLSFDPMSSSPIIHEPFNYTHVADRGDGFIYLLSGTTGDIYKLDPNTYMDEGYAIIVEMRTDKLDFGSYLRKFISNVKIVADRYELSNIVGLTWSDDDYETWSNLHTVDLNDDFPYLGRLGAFRRRAWRLVHVANQPLRVEALEVLIEEGIS